MLTSAFATHCTKKKVFPLKFFSIKAKCAVFCGFSRINRKKSEWKSSYCNFYFFIFFFFFFVMTRQQLFIYLHFLIFLLISCTKSCAFGWKKVNKKRKQQVTENQDSNANLEKAVHEKQISDPVPTISLQKEFLDGSFAGNFQSTTLFIWLVASSESDWWKLSNIGFSLVCVFLHSDWI